MSSVDAKQRRTRIGVLALVLAGLFGLVAVRVVALVALDGPRLNSLAATEHSEQVELEAPRGPIVDRNGELLALSGQAQSIYARPHRLLATTTAARREKLAAALGLTRAELETKLKRPAHFVWLARRLDRRQAEAVEALDLDGVGSIGEFKRFYPESNLAAAVVGLAGADNQGLSGIELSFDKLLHGKPIALREDRDALGHPILDDPMALTEPAPGARVELTIDSRIQGVAQAGLADEIEASSAKSGMAIVLDPFSGEVLAMASATASNPTSADRLHNPAIQDSFEPGSTIKGILAAVALDRRAVNAQDKIFCEKGEWRLGRNVIHDHGRHQWLSLGDIIQVSSNIGAAKVALALGAERYYRGLRAFGLGRPTGIDLPGETGGIIRGARNWQPIDLANHGFGQGLAVTGIQLADAYAAIANGGMLMRPYVVKAAYDAEGNVLFRHTPQEVARVVAPEVAHQVNLFLRGVVEGDDGTGRRAAVDDFMVAGKTGTAQMVDAATGGYYQSRLVASFVGFVPADDPRLVILVVLEDVSHGSFGGLVAAPVFSEIAGAALRRLNVASKKSALQAAGLLPMPLTTADTDLAEESSAPTGGVVGSVDAARTSSAIPDFSGLCLRCAIGLARSRGLNLEVEGSGYVVAQQPIAGSPSEGAPVHLTLRPPGDAAGARVRPRSRGQAPRYGWGAAT